MKESGLETNMLITKGSSIGCVEHWVGCPRGDVVLGNRGCEELNNAPKKGRLTHFYATKS